MRAEPAALNQLRDGLAAIRRQYHVPGEHPPEAQAAAGAAIARGPVGGTRRDVTDLPFVTLDPARSTDLDQAFHLVADGDDIVLHYAIADVSAWVAGGDAIDAEAWRRGATIYLPDGRAALYPPVLSEGAASLLPDGPRPAVLLTVRIAPGGAATLDGAERATVSSHAKLAYETVSDDDFPDAAIVREVIKRINDAENARGAGRVEFPEPEVVADPSAPGGLVVRAAPPHPTEAINAALSLAANLAAAAKLLSVGTGLYRVMPEATPERLASLRRTARALGIQWDKGISVRQLNERLDPTQPRQAFLLRSIRRAAGSATYATFAPGAKPWHSAIAAPYAHATAPLRRLADRYVLDLAVAVHADEHPGRPEVLGQLPEVMERAEARQGQVDGAATDLVEALMLADRVGDVFDATVVDADRDGARVQLTAPPVRSRADLGRVDPGDEVRVRLTAANVAERRLTFEKA